MPSIFVLNSEGTSGISSFDHIHQFDNGWLLCYDNWGEFTIEKLLLADARVFFSRNQYWELQGLCILISGVFIFLEGIPTVFVESSGLGIMESAVILTLNTLVDFHESTEHVARLDTPSSQSLPVRDLRKKMKTKESTLGARPQHHGGIQSDKIAVKTKDTHVFPGNDFDKIKAEALDVLKKKRMVETSKLFLQDLDWAIKIKLATFHTETSESAKRKSAIIDTITAMDRQTSETSDSTKEKSAGIDTITAMDRQMSETSDSTIEKSAAIDTITARDRQTSETSHSIKEISAGIDTITAIDSQALETSDSTKEKSAGIDTITAMERQMSETSDSTKEKSVAIDTITAMDSQTSETSDSTKKNKPVLTLSLQWIVKRQKLQIVQKKNQSPLTLSLLWIDKLQKLLM
ncbi:unnamed protein product [Mytilus coruscus]|uniref:Uncharacterized protein n=1 Tax=Mytilus coruscus TaxID=42192 RepID=A0A6J8BLM0_MYTCO|nr:unnamed protein product [Mytilus coruscus]